MALEQLIKEQQQSNPPDSAPVSASPNTPSQASAASMVKQLAGPGKLLSESWNILTSRFWLLLKVFYGPILLLMLLAGLLGSLIVLFGFFRHQPLVLIIAILAAVIAIAVMIILPVWQSLAFIITLRDMDQGITFKQAYKQAWPKIISLYWIGILQGFVTLGAFILFVIPGFIVALWLTFSQYVLVLEDRRGLNALLISREYVRGKWWGVLGRLIIPVLISIPIFILLGIFFPKSQTVSLFTVLGSLIDLLVNVMLSLWFGIYTYRLFVSLKETKGEISPEGKSKTWLIAYAILGLIIIPLMIILSLFAVSRLGSILKSPAASNIPGNSLALPFEQMSRARDQSRQFDQAHIKRAIEMYQTVNLGKFPQNLDELVAGGFLNQIPTDPQTRQPYGYSLNPDGDDYRLCIEFELQPRTCTGSTNQTP